MLGLEIMINKEILKYKGHISKLMHILAILAILVRHLSFLMTILRYFYEIKSSVEVDKFLYLVMALLNFSLEKGGYLHICFNKIFSKRLGLIR